MVTVERSGSMPVSQPMRFGVVVAPGTLTPIGRVRVP